MTLKILSDFDGVWTSHQEEADAVFRCFRDEAGRLAGVEPEAVERDFALFRALVLGAPEMHGWRFDGRVTAYVDEDPFCLANALGAFLAEAEGERARFYRGALARAGFANPEDFANDCYFRATSTFRRERPPALVRGAARAMAELAELGAEVVIVSNSPPEKIHDWFEEHGVHTDAARVRVRGHADKHVLGPGETSLVAGGRRVRVDRPRYRRILVEECPDVVIGDVFSLDLALPAWLRREDEPGAPGTVLLHRHAHTPAWVQELVLGELIDCTVRGVHELPGLLRERFLPRPPRTEIPEIA